MSQMPRYPLVPGPTTVPRPVLAEFGRNYPSGDLEPEYIELYARTQENLRRILATRHTFALMTGEAMLALWGALKSCLRPGDRVVAVANGLFGQGIGEMAARIGADVRYVEGVWDDAPDLDAVERAVVEHRPRLVSVVHGETPAGLLNPVGEIGAILRCHGNPLYYVDAVATAGGTPVPVDDWGIDLLVTGSQKCFSSPPDIAIVGISERAWQAAAEVGYAGYDALLPWRDVLTRRPPYTPNWHGTAALHAATGALLREGVEAVYRRHEVVAQRCRDLGRELGLELYPREAWACPTVTAFRVPEGLTWEALRDALRERGVVFGGNWGKLAGRVFRVGHMGAQARPELVEGAMRALGGVLRHVPAR